MGFEESSEAVRAREVPDRISESPARILTIADLWPSFAFGTCRLVDHSFSSESCHAVLHPCSPRRSRASREQRQLLRRLVLGQPQKAIALEVGISCAAVTLRAQRCIRRLGLTCRLSHLPLTVVAAGVAFHASPRIAWELRVARRVVDGTVLDVCSFARPDQWLPEELSEAEQAVVRLLVEGYSQADIAVRRGTTARTAGNQIGAVFSKLGVTGRLELIPLLMKHAAGNSFDYCGQQ